MKKIVALLLASLLVFSCTSCGGNKGIDIDTTPQIEQMKAICEFAVLECYYHNVAKFSEEDVNSFLWFKWGEKHVWIEYSGIIKIGVDMSKVAFDVSDTTVSITLPPATVLSCNVDSASLTKDSFYVEKGTVEPNAEDQTYALSQAQLQMKETALNDTRLMNQAQDRVKELLEDYINNIGSLVGVEYEIEWNYIN